MFILKETENSDVRCGSTVTLFASEKEAQDKMHELYEKSLHIFGGDFAAEENELADGEDQRWACITPSSAHIQDGLDAYDWAISEEPEWVQKKNYHDEDTGISDKNSRKLLFGDKVVLLDKFHGTVIFESGAYGVGFDAQNTLDWGYIESQIEPVTGCDNQPAFCRNDNFVSLWELLWNFNCEDDVCVVLEKIEEEKHVESRMQKLSCKEL